MAPATLGAGIVIDHSAAYLCHSLSYHVEDSFAVMEGPRIVPEDWRVGMVAVFVSTDEDQSTRVYLLLE